MTVLPASQLWDVKLVRPATLHRECPSRTTTPDRDLVWCSRPMVSAGAGAYTVQRSLKIAFPACLDAFFDAAVLDDLHPSVALRQSEDDRVSVRPRYGPDTADVLHLAPTRCAEHVREDSVAGTRPLEWQVSDFGPTVRPDRHRNYAHGQRVEGVEQNLLPMAPQP